MAPGARQRSQHPRAQRGVALITAMLVVAVTTVAVAEVAGQQLVDIRRTGSLLAADRAALAARGVEAWARATLARDAAGDPVDHLQEDWARLLPPTEIEDGTVSGDIVDLQARLNLNGLLGADGSPDAVSLRRFQRLLTAMDAPPELAQAVLDWMDADTEPRFPGGAEDSRYLEAEPPYRAANRPFVSVTELRLVAGMDDALFGRLAPHLTALPGPTPVNVNTASPVVLRTLADDITRADAEALAEARRDNPFTDVETFLRHPALAGREVEAEGLGVSSRYFLARARVELEDTRAWMGSFLARGQAAQVTVLRRTRAPEEA